MSVTASEGFTTEFRTQLAIVVKFFFAGFNMWL